MFKTLYFYYTLGNHKALIDGTVLVHDWALIQLLVCMCIFGSDYMYIEG